MSKSRLTLDTSPTYLPCVSKSCHIIRASNDQLKHVNFVPSVFMYRETLLTRQKKLTTSPNGSISTLCFKINKKN